MLKDIGKKYGTDKAKHNCFGETYMDIYERYFAKYRDKKINILELGIKKGDSLRAWHEYFHNANIFGLDINASLWKPRDRVKVYEGYQDDKKVIDKMVIDSGGGFDIVLDDASHLNEPTIKSFKLLWPHVKSGGLYIIEDLRNSYTGNMVKEMKRGHWRGRNWQKKSTRLFNTRKDVNKFFFDKIKKIDYRIGSMRYIHFWPMIAIMERI